VPARCLQDEQALQFDHAARVWRARGLFVLTLDGEAIAELTFVVDPALAPVFGPPPELC
jgi:hypothetical protein